MTKNTYETWANEQASGRFHNPHGYPNGAWMLNNIWSNPAMSEYARHIFKAGEKAGIKKAQHYLSIASKALAE